MKFQQFDINLNLFIYINDPPCFTKLVTDYSEVKDRDLVKLDDLEPILYTNDTNNFTCRMATYLFLPKLQLSLSFSNGTTAFSEGIEKYRTKFIIMIKNTLDFENEQIPPFHDFEAVWTVTVPLGAVAVNCYGVRHIWSSQFGKVNLV